MHTSAACVLPITRMVTGLLRTREENLSEHAWLQVTPSAGTTSARLHWMAYTHIHTNTHTHTLYYVSKKLHALGRSQQH